MIGVGVSVCTAAVLGGGGDAPSFALTITGLTGGEARPGDHASLGYTIDPDNGTETVAWGVSAGDSSYGTGASPSDFTAGDGGSLVLTVTDGGETRSVSAPIRYAAAVNTVAPVVSGGTSLGSTLTVANGTWTAAGGTYSRQWQRDGVNIAGQTGTTYDIVQADSGADIRCIVTYTNSGGAVSANSNAVTAQVFAAPIISGVPLISGTEQVGQTLTTTPASVTGNPTPSRTWQWERSGTPISGATSATYDLVAADEGETITVVQTETNALGADDAESAATGAIAAAPAAFVVTSMSLVDIGGGVGQLTLTFDAGETDGTPALVRGYIKEPASSPPADGAAVASGVGAAATFEIVSTVGGVINAEVPIIGDPISGLRDVFVAASKTIPYNPGSVWSNVVSVTGVDFDTKPATLTGLTVTDIGQTTATATVTSDEAGGTIYFGVRPTADAALTSAQLIAGSGGAGVAWDTDATPTADGNNAGSFTGLTASTAYRVDAVQVDANGNTSAVVSSAEFTTANAGGSAGQIIGFTQITSSLNLVTPSGNAGDLLVFFLDSNGAGQFTLSGAGLTPTTDATDLYYTSDNNSCQVFYASLSASTAGITVTATSPGSIKRISCWNIGPHSFVDAAKFVVGASTDQNQAFPTLAATPANSFIFTGAARRIGWLQGDIVGPRDHPQEPTLPASEGTYIYNGTQNMVEWTAMGATPGDTPSIIHTVGNFTPGIGGIIATFQPV